MAKLHTASPREITSPFTREITSPFTREIIVRLLSRNFGGVASSGVARGGLGGSSTPFLKKKEKKRRYSYLIFSKNKN